MPDQSKVPLLVTVDSVLGDVIERFRCLLGRVFARPTMVHAVALLVNFAVLLFVGGNQWFFKTSGILFVPVPAQDT